MLSLCLLSSCTPDLRRFPTVPPLEEGPHDDPARDAQSRLLREAYRAFVQERYPAAVLFFRRFVDGSPDSPRLAEARWWLGRAHEQLGEYRAAMVQYRIMASGRLSHQLNGQVYEGHALRRLDELRQLHADLNGPTKQLALRIGMNHLPTMPSLTPWLRELWQGGVTALVLEGVQAQASDGVVVSSERVKGIVTEAHNLDLLVWVAMDIHQPQGVDLKPEWVSGTINGRASEGTPAITPDIANPDYQAYLEELVKILSRTGCDGLFLSVRSVPGFAGEFSDGSFRMFTSSFGLDLSPQQVLGVERPADSSARASVYWRWVGWKGLSSAKLMARLRTVLRRTNPTAGLLLEVHQATLSSPLQGLEQYGEDVAELAQRTGGSMVVRRESPGGEALIEKLGQQLGTERVWIEIPTGVAANPPSVAALGRATLDMLGNRRWHMLILPEPAPAVP